MIYQPETHDQSFNQEINDSNKLSIQKNEIRKIKTKF